MINTVLSKLVAWWRIHVIFSKTLVFVWVSILTTSFVEFGVASVIVDYFTEVLNVELWQAAIISSLTDALTSLFVISPRHSESYVGRFNVIIFFTGAYVTGLTFLSVCEAPTPLTVDWSFQFFIFFSLAFLLLYLGRCGNKSTVPEFLEYQLMEKLKRDREMNPESQSMDEEKEEERNEVRLSVWCHSAWSAGALATAFLPARITWAEIFKISSLLVGAGYLIFYSGCIFYRFEKPKRFVAKETETSFLRKFCRVYKAAFRKRKREYPTSPDCYYWKDLRQNHFYSRRAGHVQFLPKAFGWLDKTAITIDDNDRDLCSVKEVREVKRVSTVIVLFCTLLPYGLMPPIALTFFVQQANDIIVTNVYDHVYNVSALFVMKLGMRCLVTWLFWWRKPEKQSVTKVRIFGGMVCSVLCCVTAWRVELRRRSSDDMVSISWLIPQFLLLGLAEALVEDGVAVFFHNHVPPSMRSIWEPLRELLFATGNFLNVVFTLIFARIGWLQGSLDDSKLERYYVWLAILNFVFLFIYGCYSKDQALTEPYPVDEELRAMENIVNVGSQEEDAIQEGLDAVLPSSTTVATHGNPT